MSARKSSVPSLGRDQLLKGIRMAAGIVLLIGGLGMAFLSRSVSPAAPWVSGSVAVFGLFLLATADSRVYSKKDLEMVPIAVERLSQVRTTGDYGSFEVVRVQFGEDTDYYLSSPRVDRLLLGMPLPTVLEREPFRLDEDIRRLAAFITDSTLSPGSGRLSRPELRLATDITEAVFRQGLPVTLQPADYRTALCTNEMVLSSVVLRQDKETLLDGFGLMAEDRMLRTLAESRCANLIGFSSVALLSDGTLLLPKQRKPYARNFGRIVPTVSSTLALSDYDPSLPLQGMVEKAVAARLRQDYGYDGGNRVHTATVGYARLLSRGGKPEMLCFTVINDDQDAVLRGSGGMEIPSRVALDAVPSRDLLDLVRSLLDPASALRPEMSVQLHSNLAALAAALDGDGRGTLLESLGLG